MASSAGKRTRSTKRSHAQSECQDIDFFIAGGDEKPNSRALEGLMGLRSVPAGQDTARKAPRKGAHAAAAAEEEAVPPHPVDVSVVHNALLYGAPIGGAMASAGGPSVADGAYGQQPQQGHPQMLQMLQPNLAALAAQGHLVPTVNPAMPMSTLAFLAQGVDPSCQKVRLDSAKHHAEVERDRRGKLNGAIDQLRAFFPDMPGPKHLVIEKAVAHIEQLQFEVHQLRNSSDSNSNSSSNSTASRNQSKDDQNAVLDDVLASSLQTSAFPMESSLLA